MKPKENRMGKALKVWLFIMLFILMGCSNSFKGDALKVARIFGDAYQLEQYGKPVDGFMNNGKTKVTIIPTDRSKSKKYLIKNKKSIDIFYSKLIRNSINEDAEKNFDTIFLKAIINLDYFCLTGSYYEKDYNPQKLFSKSDLLYVSEWIRHEYYPMRMPVDIRNEWMDMNEDEKLSDIYEGLIFLAHKYQQ